MNKFLKTIKLSYHYFFPKKPNNMFNVNMVSLENTQSLYPTTSTTHNVDLDGVYYGYNTTVQTLSTFSGSTHFDTIIVDNKLFESDKKIFNTREEIFIKKLDKIKKKNKPLV